MKSFLMGHYNTTDLCGSSVAAARFLPFTAPSRANQNQADEKSLGDNINNNTR
jgi:hypothetical protein